MQNPFSLKGKCILVTGASSGIGQQIAITLSELEATVIIAGRNEERLNETFSKLKGDNHLSIIADLSDDKQIKELVQKIPCIINGVVHSAGLTSHMPAQLIGTKQLDEVMKINFHAPVLLNRYLISLRKIMDGSSIVFLSTIATLHPYYGGSLYSASKKALEGYSVTLALELAPRKIRSNCISPAMVETPMLERTAKTISTEALEGMRAIHPLGFGTTQDVANTVIFLLSDGAKWITGSNIVMGGF